MNKKVIRITESELYNIIKESLSNIICESYDSEKKKEEMDSDFDDIAVNNRVNRDSSMYFLKKKANKNIKGKSFIGKDAKKELNKDDYPF